MKPERITKVRFRYCSRGLSPKWVTDYSNTTVQALSALFELPASAVVITSEERLPEDAPFSLTCYAGKSASGEGLARAARAVLAPLLAAQRLAESGQGVLLGWEPGVDLDADLEALKAVAGGCFVSPGAADWLADTAELFGMAGDQPAPAQAQYIISQLDPLAIQANDTGTPSTEPSLAV